MNKVNGRKVRVMPHTNSMASNPDERVHPGDICQIIACGNEGYGWATVRRVSDGKVDTCPLWCFRYLNNRRIKV